LSVDRAAMMGLLIGPRRKIHIGPSIIIDPSMAGGSCPWHQSIIKYTVNLPRDPREAQPTSFSLCAIFFLQGGKEGNGVGNAAAVEIGKNVVAKPR
jgi:hypothetical protein